MLCLSGMFWNHLWTYSGMVKDKLLYDQKAAGLSLSRTVTSLLGAWVRSLNPSKMHPGCTPALRPHTLSFKYVSKQSKTRCVKWSIPVHLYLCKWPMKHRFIASPKGVTPKGTVTLAQRNISLSFSSIIAAHWDRQNICWVFLQNSFEWTLTLEFSFLNESAVAWLGLIEVQWRCICFMCICIVVTRWLESFFLIIQNRERRKHLCSYEKELLAHLTTYTSNVYWLPVSSLTCFSHILLYPIFKNNNIN